MLQAARPDTGFAASDAATASPESAASDSPRFDPARVETPKPGTPLPPSIARQIAEALPTADGPGFDLSLSPEELGQVRLRLVSVEGGSLLMIQAERPETLDLMRRHIGTLEQDLRDLGHEGLEMRFSTSSGGDSGGQRHSPLAGSAPALSPLGNHRLGETPDAPPQVPGSPRVSRDHLDIRL